MAKHFFLQNYKIATICAFLAYLFLAYSTNYRNFTGYFNSQRKKIVMEHNEIKELPYGIQDFVAHPI